VNTLGRALDVAVTTGLTTPARRVVFSDGLQRSDVDIAEGTLTIGSMVSIRGALSVRSTTSDEFGESVTRLSLGVKDMQGTVNLGGLEATLSDGQGAVLLEHRSGLTESTRHALQLEGDIALSAAGVLTIEADNLEVAVNNWGSDLQTSVVTGVGRYDLNLPAGVSRLQGEMEADLAGLVVASGDLIIESRSNQPLKLSDGSNLNADLLVIGGINNYFLFPEDSSKPALWRVNYAFELQYQAPYIQTDNLWGYTPLINLITIPNSCQFEPPYTGPTYIMAFNSAMMPTYAFLGTTNFNNTDNTIITFKRDIVYSFDPTLPWIVYPANGPLPPPSPVCPGCESATNDYLYYLYDGTTVTIYQPTFANFILAYDAAISIQDLLFSTERNQEFIRVTPGLYSQIMNNGEDMYRDKNYYFINNNDNNLNNNNNNIDTHNLNNNFNNNLNNNFNNNLNNNFNNNLNNNNNNGRGSIYRIR
jgi:hypothetical protein